ncbi:TlpA family protein disulfide reductase [Muricauda ruestringensis]|uniref:TlpA family protein disulfide reductase n=1 Tax=Flagellimonas aurea TaxID=2915619 RepID=A0ABS3G899_9FLAO|nr:TlpA disulfide reductase family protein [Allomuricauda aurea]MAO17303.1 thiol-disulfide oxidoreductase [Allomuricauda sp.]MBO0354792.1 TlpA family protein disulfide reductase [Allomuricauda aurea]|tara:strand:- start:409 stop:975 length:567 start_codon:yes stop_codon:yes gene_type:complete
MKLTKEQIGNGIWILAILLILFTPIGFHARVLVNKVVAAVISPSAVDEKEQATLADYHWNLIDLEGESINLQSKKGHVILVNVWATWCPPCVAELPGFVELYSDYKDKVTFVFVANDEKDRVIAFLEKKEYRLPVYLQASATPKELESGSIPVTYIIDKEGGIVVNKTGAANWNSEKTRSMLDKLLAD